MLLQICLTQLGKDVQKLLVIFWITNSHSGVWREHRTVVKTLDREFACFVECRVMKSYSRSSAMRHTASKSPGPSRRSKSPASGTTARKELNTSNTQKLIFFFNGVKKPVTLSVIHVFPEGEENHLFSLCLRDLILI